MNIDNSTYVVLLVVAALQVAVPLVAAIRAFGRGQSGWGIGCLIALFVPFGFVFGAAYLVGPYRVAGQAS